MSVQQTGAPSAIRLRFGPFELNVAERSLKKANQVIPLGGRAYDILIALLEKAGEVCREVGTDREGMAGRNGRGR